jgi:hypothetical protein
VFVIEAEIYLHGAPAIDLAAELERIKPSRPDDALLIFFSGMIDAADGKRREALAVARELEKSSGPDLRLAPWIARIYLMLNERELALSWLERGFEAGAIAVFFKDAPLWDPLRSDPRFAQLVRRMTGSQ